MENQTDVRGEMKLLRLESVCMNSHNNIRRIKDIFLGKFSFVCFYLLFVCLLSLVMCPLIKRENR